MDELESWGFDRALTKLAAPEGVFAEIPPTEEVFNFETALKQEWCRFKSKRRLVGFCERDGYPPQFIASEKITQTGFARLLAEEQRKRRVKNTEAQQKKRARDRAASQVPEPKEGQLAGPLKPVKGGKT